MLCGGIEDIEVGHEVKPQQQTLNWKNYLRCLRILRDKVNLFYRAQRES